MGTVQAANGQVTNFLRYVVLRSARVELRYSPLN